MTRPVGCWPRIEALAVVVPARDEEDHIRQCLSSIGRALDQIPAEIAVAVTVVLDRCGDRTSQRTHSLLDGWPQARSVQVIAAQPRHTRSASGPDPAHTVAGAGVGAVRDLGVRDALARLTAQSTAATWVLSTDADTVVPSDWALAHLARADAGACGVAGLADLATLDTLTLDAHRLYQDILSDGMDRESHRHIYAANLGVRASAYLAVGGFPGDGAGEEHGLWQRLRTAGYPITASTEIRVRTSARTCGRANGGLADLLRALHNSDGVPPSTSAPEMTPQPGVSR